MIFNPPNENKQRCKLGITPQEYSQMLRFGELTKGVFPDYRYQITVQEWERLDEYAQLIVMKIVRNTSQQIDWLTIGYSTPHVFDEDINKLETKLATRKPSDE